jgi:hypothetical protein
VHRLLQAGLLAWVKESGAAEPLFTIDPLPRSQAVTAREAAADSGRGDRGRARATQSNRAPGARASARSGRPLRQLGVHPTSAWVGRHEPALPRSLQ